ncbi:esterase FrsA [Streptacidiphilus sp. MAP12-33]|uniref:alpha/beta fold hydrolase n=1 Tax=Streptacidiphilus sp. MAP12-33 TaxID=3156266 RepID=UPI003518F9E5
MAYQWPMAAYELFDERYPQMVNLGLPAADVTAVRGAVKDMWADEPGGWVHEWTRLASGYAGAGRHDLAYLAYGWAKFPVLADEAKRTALSRQIEQYQRAAAGFPVPFERRVLDLPYGGSTTPVPVHLLGPSGRPVLVASGGLDSWKMDLHPLFVQLVLHGGVQVMAFDLPGTGESRVPLTASGGFEIVQGLIRHARALGNGRVGHFGFSMGGYFAARSGLSGAVDAAVDQGGPVRDSFTESNLQRLMFGMADIFENTLGFERRPELEEVLALMVDFPLDALLAQDLNCPMLAVNGADDVHVTQTDTLLFEGRRATDVRLVPGTGHVAASKLHEVIPMIAAWLTDHLT